MPRTNTVNEKWEIASSLTNGVCCWVRRLWSQHISVTFSPPPPLQFVGKRKKVKKPPKQIVEQSRKCWSELMTREFLALIFHQRRRMTNIDLPSVLVLWEWCEEKEKDWSVLRQRVFIRQSNFLGTLTHPSGRRNTTMIIHNRPIRSNPEVIVHWKVNKHYLSMNLLFSWREW